MKHFSIRRRMMVYIFIACLIMFSILGSIVYVHVGNLLADNCKSSGRDIAETVAKEISGDMFEDITGPEEAGFKIIHYQLKKFNNLSNVKYIYTIKKIDDSIYFVDDIDEERPVGYLSEYRWIDGMNSAFEGQVISSKYVISDEWGKYYSSFAPITKVSGEVVGLVGVDTDYATIRVYLNRLFALIVIIILAFSVLSIVLYNAISEDFIDRDVITELINQEKFIEVGEKIAKNGNLKHYTAFKIDIKDFKYINKKYSYEIGNDVLRKVALIISEHLKYNEYASRVGNDHFFALVRNENADAFMGSLNNVVLNLDCDLGEIELPINFRCGISKISDHESISDITSKCSVALERAIGKTGENTIAYYSDYMYDDITRNRDIIKAYREALDNREFQVYYQPKVDTRINKVCGAEALVRWIRNGEVISPGNFIPIIEKEGLISELDLYVYDTVCSDIVRWKRMGYDVVPISSNFSKDHLFDKDFANKIIDIAQRNGTDTKYLDIELTESSGYSNANNLYNFIQKMKESGIKVSMDDFGTGYSSLSMLGNVKCDIVKIDKSFVDKIISDDKDGAIMVENVINMINNLGREVICEGVETGEQLEFIKKTGCHIIQGYYFDKPLTVVDFENRLKNPLYA